MLPVNTTKTGLVPQGDPVFDPKVHLSYSPPASALSMEDLGLGHAKAPSKMGVTAPFPLASLDGVRALRQALLQPRVIDHHLFFAEWTGNTGILRGMAPDASKFIHDFWTHPKTLKAMEDAVGEPLVPVFDYEVAHTNIQVPDGQDQRSYIDSLSADPFTGAQNKGNAVISTPREPARAAAQTTMSNEDKTSKQPGAVVPYHIDGYPWVCVLMLSDVEGMEGGETEIKKGDGSTVRVLGPGIGHAVMMQGGSIEHCALPALNQDGRERVTMITSLRPARPHAERAVLHKAYEERLAARRNAIREAYGSVGGLKSPTVDLDEMKVVQRTIESVIASAIEQMGMSNPDPEDGLWTPKALALPQVSSSVPSTIV